MYKSVNSISSSFAVVAAAAAVASEDSEINKFDSFNTEYINLEIMLMYVLKYEIYNKTHKKEKKKIHEEKFDVCNIKISLTYGALKQVLSNFVLNLKKSNFC